MEYQTFLKRILTKVNALLPEGRSAEYHEVKKNNGAAYTGIVMKPCASLGASPIYYMESIFESVSFDGFSDEKEIDGELAEIAKKIAESLLKQPPKPSNLKVLNDPEYVKSHVIYRLVGREMNLEMLEDLVHRDFLDMAVVYAVSVFDDQIGSGLVAVSRSFAEDMGICEEELFGLARENTARLFGERMVSFGEIVPLPREEGDLQDFAYVLSNEQAFYGAAALLYSGEIRRLAETLESDLYILPASVHEVIVLPKRERELPFLREMVRNVNRQEVKREDVLTDSVYVYDLLEDRLKVAS